MAGSAFGGPARVHKAGQRSRLFVRARHVAPLPAASILRTSVVRNTPKSRISSYPQPRKGVNERAFAAGLAEAPAMVLARISHQLTVEAPDRPAITSLRLLTVLNVLFKYASIVQETGRRAARALY